MKISEYQQLFLSEADEILNAANGVVVSLEKRPGDIALVNSLFRLSHTLKSMAQSMQYDSITRVTHALENVLALCRSGTLKLQKSAVELLFEALDVLGALVAEVRDGKPTMVDMRSLLRKLEEIASGASGGEELDPADVHVKGHGVGIDPQTGTRESKAAHVSVAAEELRTVRVPLGQLDSLMNIAGELALNRTRLVKIAQGIEDASLREAVAHFSALSSQLQEHMMGVRLVPLEYIFNPYPRLIRDMAADQRKEIDLVIEGSEIGMDRSIQAEINESLLHLLKNAVVHGIEAPDVRVARGKTRGGTIRMVSRREGDAVVIELSDDGMGMAIEQVKATALDRGVVTPDELATMNSEEIILLVSRPGYTGAAKVSTAAGRGVGLNAVRMKVELYGGSLSIHTESGKGTTFVIKLPISMAVVQAMLVGVGGETYCIPLSYIVETMKMSVSAIKRIERQEIVPYRDTVLPLIRLRQALSSTSGSAKNDGNGRETVRTAATVVVELGQRRAGLIVDDLLGQQEVVVKGLTGMMKRLKAVSGVTILGTGRVALILDVPAILSAI